MLVYSDKSPRSEFYPHSPRDFGIRRIHLPLIQEDEVTAVDRGHIAVKITSADGTLFEIHGEYPEMKNLCDSLKKVIDNHQIF